jgi:hypothetical protein
MWNYETQVMDEKGKMVKGTGLSLEPVEGSKRVRVAHYTPKQED